GVTKRFEHHVARQCLAVVLSRQYESSHDLVPKLICFGQRRWKLLRYQPVGTGCLDRVRVSGKKRAPRYRNRSRCTWEDLGACRPSFNIEQSDYAGRELKDEPNGNSTGYQYERKISARSSGGLKRLGFPERDEGTQPIQSNGATMRIVTGISPVRWCYRDGTN